MIQLVGPGGSGKTTIGSALAAHLQVPFVDLDAEFTARHGDISVYLDARRRSARWPDRIVRPTLGERRRS